MSSSSQPTEPMTDPEVAATVRLLHRRHGWGRATITTFFAFVLAAGAYSSAKSQGTPPPAWFFDVVVVLGTLTVVGIFLALVDTAILRRRPPAVRAQAVPLAAHHPSHGHAHHYPPRHRLSWLLRWVGMLLILAVAVVSLPGVVDGVAYLAGDERSVTFDPLAYDTECYLRGGCQTNTDGILETGGTGVEATWPAVVPLDKPFQVRAPVWRWGLGEAMISSDWIAVGAILICLLMEGAAVLVVVRLVQLVRNVLRQRAQGGPAPASAS